MVGPGHFPIISKYGPSLSKAVGPSILVVKKSHFNKKYSSHGESTNSIKQKVHVGSQYSKTCLKQPLKKDKTKILITNGSLVKVESIAECSPFIAECSPLSNQQSIYIYAYKGLCQCVGKVYNPNVNCG